MDKALIAMSGGVDSSVAAWLTKEMGFDCIGAMMKLYNSEITANGGCCSADDADDARDVAFRLDIPFYVFNFNDSFNAEVISRFVTAYQNGATPNPCIDCNRYMKFNRFLKRADEIGCKYIVTGHYARIEESRGRFFLKKGTDADKDQSYVLYSLTQEQLSRTLLPLGNLSKPKVREIAERQGFINAKKRDSQDICFAPDGDYAGFIERYTGKKHEPGYFIDENGNNLGRHKGIACYTVGQRRGLGISATESLYVREICPENNTVVLSTRDRLYSSELTACDINLIAVDRIYSPLRVQAKIRYRHKEQPAAVLQTEDDVLRVVFDEPQRAITKGQAVVLYDGDTVIGGGTITHSS